MTAPEQRLERIFEAILLAASEPVPIARLCELLAPECKLEAAAARAALARLADDYADRAVALVEVASGFRFQVRQEYAPWPVRLQEQRPVRYSRATLETLALIAYRQPITRGEIEQIRGVAVSTQIMRGLQERGWIKIVGHRDVPGRPAVYATTNEFLDYFNLQSLGQLPALLEPRAETQLPLLAQAVLSPSSEESS